MTETFDKDRKYWFLTYYKLRCLENGKVPENSNELKQIINFALQYEKNISQNRAIEYLDSKSQTYWKPNLIISPSRVPITSAAQPISEIFVPEWPAVTPLCTSYTPAIHLKCEDNAASTVVTNAGTTGNCTASVNTNTLSAAGKINNCFYFPAVYSGEIDCGNDAAIQPTGKLYTIAFWLWIDTLHAVYKPLVGKLNGSSDGFGVYTNDGTGVTLYAWNGSGYDAAPSPTIAKEEWAHVIAIFDGVNITTYANNVAGTPTGFDHDISNSADNMKVRWQQGGVGTMVKLDDIRVYPGIAADADLRAALYNGGAGTDETTICI